MPNFFSFLSYVVLTTFTPGPNNIMSMSNASKYGFKKSFNFIFGAFVGFFIVLALCTAFSSFLLSVLPTVKPILKIIGASYILWLAYKTMKSSYDHDKDIMGVTNTFFSGLMLQFINPKVIIYGITITSTYITPYYDSFFILFLFTLLLAFIGFISVICWGLFGSIFQKFLKNHTLLVNSLMSILLVYCAVSLFL